MLIVLSLTACEKEVTPEPYQQRLTEYHAESLRLPSVAADSIHRFQQKVGSLAVAYPIVTEEDLYQQILQNIHDAYLTIGVTPGEWGDDQLIEFEIGE